MKMFFSLHYCSCCTWFSLAVCEAAAEATGIKWRPDLMYRDQQWLLVCGYKPDHFSWVSKEIVFRLAQWLCRSFGCCVCCSPFGWAWADVWATFLECGVPLVLEVPVCLSRASGAHQGMGLAGLAGSVSELWLFKAFPSVQMTAGWKETWLPVGRARHWLNTHFSVSVLLCSQMCFMQEYRAHFARVPLCQM